MKTTSSVRRIAAASVIAWSFVAVGVAQGQTISVKAYLHGGEEVPPVVSGAHGVATVTIDRATQQLTYRVDVYNLPTGLTGGHIHVGSAGVSGPIVIGFAVTQTISNDFAIVGTATAADLQPRAVQGVNSWDDLVASVASGVTYVNIHTQLNPGGEIRGQLCPDSASANAFNGIAVCTSRR